MTKVIVPGLQHPEMVDQVKRGMQVLDQDRPGWELSIYLPDLDINSGCTCVLGQVYRDVSFEDFAIDGIVGAVHHLFGILWIYGLSDVDYQILVDHGFAVSRDYFPEGETAKLQLESVWKVFIGQRTGVQAICPNDHENIPGTVFCKECGESLLEEVNF